MWRRNIRRLALSQQANGRRYGTFATVLVLAVLVLLASGVWGAWAFFDSNNYTISLDPKAPDRDWENHPLEITAAQGDEIDVTIEGESLEGEWASSTGFFLVFGKTRTEMEEPGATDGGTRIAEPEEEDWGDSIRAKWGDFEIEADFKVPDLELSPGETIEGWITGKFEWPVAVGDGEFKDKHLTLYLPVTLHIISAAESAAVERDRYDTQSMVAGATLPVVLVLVGIAVAIKKDKDSMTKGRVG